MQEDLLQQAKTFLENGELVGIPTETVYGLASNALNPTAVAKIFQVKNRPTFDPLIIHTHSLGEFAKYVKNIPQKALDLAERFMPGSLTLLLPKQLIIPDLVTAGLDTVAIRIPNHPLTMALLQSLDFPLAAPSANPFGYISPTTADHVRQQLGDKISMILDGGASTVGVESTIIGFPEGEPTIFRLGGISVEAIEAVIGKVKVHTHSTSNPHAPGQLASHYAPRKPFKLIDFTDWNIKSQAFPIEKIGILSFNSLIVNIPFENQVILSPKSDFAEAAQRLFTGMRHLDNLPIEVIYAELLPEAGLGRAINDRLRRASVR
jgi:L-threonylcarbamoyladenylate synthase